MKSDVTYFLYGEYGASKHTFSYIIETYMGLDFSIEDIKSYFFFCDRSNAFLTIYLTLSKTVPIFNTLTFYLSLVFAYTGTICVIFAFQKCRIST